MSMGWLVEGMEALSSNDALFIEERYALLHKENSPLNLDNLIAMALK